MAGSSQLVERRDAHIRMPYAGNTALRRAQDAGLTGHLRYLAKRAFVRFRKWRAPPRSSC